MKLWINKEVLHWLEKCQDEGRTRKAEFSTFKTKIDDSEIEVDVNFIKLDCKGDTI